MTAFYPHNLSLLMKYLKFVPLVLCTGPGLVFQVYPEGLAMMAFSSMWSVLFFAMVITLGIDSTVSKLLWESGHNCYCTGKENRWPISWTSNDNCLARKSRSRMTIELNKNRPLKKP